MKNEFFVHKHIEKFLESTQASAYLKDRNGSYLAVNPVFSKIAEQSIDNIIGRNDLDLQWEKHALIMMENDKKIIATNKSKICIESAKCLYGNSYFLSHKTPFNIQRGKSIGVFGLSFLVDKEDSLFSALDELEPCLDTGFYKNISKLKTISKVTSYKLTERQSDCLFYLVKGMTIKKIAERLTLSPKTVEHYIDTVKYKLHCSSRASLIEKALQMQIIRDRL